jgi:hypothetical protein
MTHEVLELQRWPTGRWWARIALVFLAQLGLIFWLGKPQPVIPPRNEAASTIRLAGPAAAQFLALTDPTLFALPHRESFSGEAWLTIPAQGFVWSEQPYSLALNQARLGSDFNEFMATNQPGGLPDFAQPAFDLKVPGVVETELFPIQSGLRLTGALAGRRLLVAPALQPWASSEILTNSVIQVLVGADGKPISLTLLIKSGFSQADEYALREVRKARFEPLNVSDPMDPMAGLTWGQFVFEWRTLPLPATNTFAEPGPAK